jgi:hypothetical protein
MANDVAGTLRKALATLTSQKARLDSQIGAIETALQSLGGGRGQSKGAPRRARMSAAARKAVGRRMKAYWAKRRTAKSATAAKSARIAKSPKK